MSRKSLENASKKSLENATKVIFKNFETKTS